MSAVKKHKIKLREVNRHLVCRLCRGYYVDATTIAECLHSFCRSCIIKYLEKNSFCPICEVQIHTAKPHLSLRQDKALQDVVYKLVPGLYHNEMQRRRDFYSKHPEHIPASTPEQCGIEDRIIFSPDEIISLSLERLEREEYVFESISSQSSEAGSDTAQDEESIVPRQLVLKKLKTARRKVPSDEDIPSRPKRYLRCPAAVEVSHLKKFIRMKYDLGERSKVDIIHKRVSLPDHYTLMDVAYIYTWKRNGPMRLFYYHGEPRIERPKLPDAAAEVAKLPVKVKPAENEKKIEDKSLTNGVKSEKSEEKKAIRVETPRSEEAKPKTEINEKVVEPKVNGLVKECAVAEATPPKVKIEEPKTNSVLPVNGAREKANVIAEVEKVKCDSEVKQETAKTSLTNGEEKVSSAVKSTDAKSESVPLKEPLKKDVEPEKKDKPENGESVAKKDDKLKKTIANLLKNYRKESPPGEAKVEVKSPEGDSVTVTNVSKREKSLVKKEADVTIEIKSETKASEYDFESNSPPGKIISLREFTKSEQCKSRKTDNGWMSLQDFRKVMKENGETGEGSNESGAKVSKTRVVPCLKRIDENRKSPVQPKQNGKVEEKKTSPTIINIQTDEEDYRKKENRVELTKVTKDKGSPPPITIENKGGEYSIRQLDENKKPDGKEKEVARKRSSRSPEATETPAKKPKTEEVKSDSCGAMDLTKSDSMGKTPTTEASESSKKNDENMVEALISAAQKQNIEPLLRVPQFLKNSGSPPKISPGRNISPSDISQALQFFKDLRSDIRVLEAKTQLGGQSEFPSKLNPFQLYQQQMDLIKRLKKHQMMSSDYQPPPKTPKLSPPTEKPKKSPTADKPKSSGSPPKEDPLQTKSPVERALTQIQEQFELQNRMKQNLKNLPALLQFYNRPPFLYCPSVSPTKPNQGKLKSPSLSPNLQKSPKSPPSNLPLSMTSPGSSFFANQSYSPIVNTGLSSEMTFHQMFQNYLSQQEKMNQIKPPLPVSRPRHNPPTSPNPVADFYFAGPNELNRSPPKQKT